MVWINIGITILGFGISIATAVIVSNRRCNKRLAEQRNQIMSKLEETNKENN